METTQAEEFPSVMKQFCFVSRGLKINYSISVIQDITIIAITGYLNTSKEKKLFHKPMQCAS